MCRYVIQKDKQLVATYFSVSLFYLIFLCYVGVTVSICLFLGEIKKNGVYYSVLFFSFRVFL